MGFGKLWMGHEFLGWGMEIDEGHEFLEF